MSPVQNFSKQLNVCELSILAFFRIIYCCIFQSSKKTDRFAFYWLHFQSSSSFLFTFPSSSSSSFTMRRVPFRLLIFRAFCLLSMVFVSRRSAHALSTTMQLLREIASGIEHSADDYVVQKILQYVLLRTTIVVFSEFEDRARLFSLLQYINAARLPMNCSCCTLPITTFYTQHSLKYFTAL